MEDEDLGTDDDGLRWFVLVPYVAAVVVGFGVAAVCFVSWSSQCSKSELGGVAGDSVRARLCDDVGGLAGLVIAAGWVLGLVLLTFALVRWEGSVRGTAVLVLLLLAPAALPLAAYGALQQASTSCSDEDLAAYREWVAAGSSGRPPSDCRTF